MLEKRKALNTTPLERAGLTLSADHGFILTLYSGAPNGIKTALGLLPAFGKAARDGKSAYFRIGAEQVLGLGAEVETRTCLATPYGAARARISLTGAGAASFVQSQVPLDLAGFTDDAVAMTAIHHMPVLLHAPPGGGYHIYVPRSLAQSLWDWLADAAIGAG